MLNLKEYRGHADNLSDHLKWACLIAPGIILNKDGALQRTLRYRGPDQESATPEELVAMSARLNNMLKRLGSGWALYFEADRRPSTDYPQSEWQGGAAWIIDEERRAHFEDATRHFETDCYLTLTWMPPADKTNRLEKLFIEDPADAPGAFWHESLVHFTIETDRAFDLISDLMHETHFLSDDETLTYLHSCISLKRHPVTSPGIPMLIDRLIIDTPLTGGLAPMLGPETLKTISIQSFPAATEPAMLSALDHLGFSYRFVSRFLPLDKDRAAKRIRSTIRNWFLQRKSMLTMFREVMTGEPATLLNTDAENKAADADDALQILGSDQVMFGDYTCAVTLTHPDPLVAEEQARAVERVINGLGFVTINETVNAVDAWLGTLPGEAYANLRKPLINTLDLSHLGPFSSVWAGPEKNTHLDGPPLLIAKSSSGTPFRLVTHQGDVGHTMIVGPTGAGKSVLLSLLAMQFKRYDDAQIFIFDKGKSARCITAALEGDWYDLCLDGKHAFQPLGEIDTPSGLAHAQTWVLALLEQENVPVTPAIKDAIWSALQNLAETPPVQRTLTGLTALVQSEDLREALTPYTLEGPYGALLDAETDSFQASNMACFEMEELMHEPRLIAPILSYLFHRLEARFDGRPTMLILDEAWVFLDHPLFAGRLREWLKTLRKKNVSVIFATQSLADISASSIAPTLIESCPTRIFLPNARAEEPSMATSYDAFGLNARQIELIARAAPKRDYYLQCPDGNRLFDLELGPIALAFCAAGSKADQVKIRDILRTSTSAGFAAAWLEHKGLSWAADLIKTEEGAVPCAAE